MSRYLPVSECEEAEEAPQSTEYCGGQGEGTGEKIFQTGEQDGRHINKPTLLLYGR